MGPLGTLGRRCCWLWPRLTPPPLAWLARANPPGRRPSSNENKERESQPASQGASQGASQPASQGASWLASWPPHPCDPRTTSGYQDSAYSSAPPPSAALSISRFKGHTLALRRWRVMETQLQSLVKGKVKRKREEKNKGMKQLLRCFLTARRFQNLFVVSSHLCLAAAAAAALASSS